LQREIPDTCPHCRGLLIEIDHYGERLVGCIECNRWSRPEDGMLLVSVVYTQEVGGSRLSPPTIESKT